MKIDDVETPVVVLRLDHYGALGVMRSLGRLGIAVYGVHRSADAPALESAYCRGGLTWDLDEEPDERTVERLLRFAEPLGRPPILLPSNDETALLVARNADRLRAGFRFQDNSVALVESLYCKRSLYYLARRLGIPTPETSFPASREEVRELAAAARFPVVLKASDGIRVARRSGRKTVIARDAAELLAHYDQMADPAHADLMLQEYIPGGESAQWMFNGYFDARSECLFGVTGRKLRQTPVYTGMTSLGVCADNATVEALTRQFMKAIGYRGILDIGYRYDARDGAYKVLDVNPRLGATFRLFVGEDGLDVVRALYLDLTGQPVPPSRACEGRRWLVEDLDLVSSLRYHRDGVLGAGEWLRSFAGVREGAWFAADDLAPFAGALSRVIAQAARKVKKRLAAPAAGEAPAGHRERVNGHFRKSAQYWKQVYIEKSRRLAPRFYRERHAAALRWVDEVALPRAARVLDVGCGAGYAAVALARRGYRVHALDAAPEMLALARRAAKDAGLPRLATSLGDAHELAFGAGAFDLVLALGVLPWLASEARGLAEMARVLKPGGFLIATADNRASLPRLLDPRMSPALTGVRGLAKRALVRLGASFASEALRVRKHDPDEIDQLVRAAGLEKLKSATVGFGPFSLFGRELLSEESDQKLHSELQRLADQGWPLLRDAGAHYLILARKPD